MTFFGGLFKGLAAVGVLALAVGLFAISAAPTASFTMTPDGNPVIGQVVQFADTSSGSPTSWTWNFGDGGESSTQQNPTHVFGAPGPFLVTLTASNPSGSSQSTQTVFVTTDDTLRLNGKGGHAFTVKLTATDQHHGNAVVIAHAIPQNDVFGYFSFPPPTGSLDNPEVFIKILDGRVINGEFWVFYGHLTDLIYDLTVTEVDTGLIKTYHKDAGATAGGNDTSGFHPTPTATPVTATPTPTVPAAIVVNLVASDFQWSFNGGGESFTFHVGQPYQLRISRANGSHTFSGISGLGCAGSALSSVSVCNFTPTSAQIGSHGFACTNPGCGFGHSSMQSGNAMVSP